MEIQIHKWRGNTSPPPKNPIWYAETLIHAKCHIYNTAHLKYDNAITDTDVMMNGLNFLMCHSARGYGASAIRASAGGFVFARRSNSHRSRFGTRMCYIPIMLNEYQLFK